MKKKFLALMTATCMMMLCACGGSDAEYLKDFDASKYVTLGEYKGIEVQMTQTEPAVTDEYLQGYIDYVLQNSPTYVEVTDRAVEMGDMTNIDYVGKLDGVAFDGGTAQGQSLEIGSGTFIDGFEDGMVGMQIGETRDVEATFPDPYTNNPDLAGKTAVFTVTLNSISVAEVPELTDEYVASLGIEECSTVDEYRAYVKDVLMEQAQSSYDSEKLNLAVEAIQASSQFKDAPEGMVNRMNNSLVTSITSYAQMYGADISEYVSIVYGGEAADYEATLLEQSKLMAQQYVMMQAIADAEGLSVSDEELEKQIAEEAAGYGYEVDAYKEMIDVEAYREYLMTERVMEFLNENVTAIPAEATTAE
ncbi:MAG: trigger factor [Lachnospiraceae bacterium]|nr:trigger factor [Lachnospiraceae bacterium]